jgi:NodT family efflux transporter outer membrane factor (OMF) lipoprotein
MLAGCAVGPDYQRPDTAVPTAWKESAAPQGGQWVAASPADALARGQWWTVFNDPALNELMPRVEVNNRNVAIAAAAYRQARALVTQQRAALFPTVTLNAAGTRNGGNSTTSTGVVTRSGNNFQVNLGGTWEPDLWGRLGRGVTGARAGEQASAADLAAATLSNQGELAANYFSIRSADAQIDLLTKTMAGYQRNLQITGNRFNAGLAPHTDLLQAQTQLANARADLLAAQQSRAQFEHAIAVLLGVPPSQFNLPSRGAWTPSVPAIPLTLPSELLQRRPDIAGAERRVAQANEQIGIAQAAWYPSLSLSASYGASGGAVADLFSAPPTAWSLGFSALQTLFNAGLTRGRVEAARAAWEQSVANYRQTVLLAFQNVEDQLSATRLLADQLEQRRIASTAADQAEIQFLNRYQAGQVAFTEVVTAQVAALSARRALVQAQASQITTAVALTQALGGGWQAPQQEASAK